MSLPQDFLELYPKAPKVSKMSGPIYWLWVFDPQSGKVIAEHNDGRHRAETIDHTKLAERVPHPERVHGYAYKIAGGYRITDWDGHPVKDKYVLKQVAKALSDQS
jgi:hypothetical protein